MFTFCAVLLVISELLHHFSSDGPALLSYARRNRVTKFSKPLSEAPRDTTTISPDERGLANETSLSARSILSNYQITLSHPVKNFDNKLMGFVTPWNRRGYTVALDAKGKFDIIVPVWYTVNFDRQISITGQNNIDKPWLRRMRTVDGYGNTPKIIPRFHFEGFSYQNWAQFIDDENLVNSFIEACMKECQENSYDGIFLDFGALAFSSVPTVDQRSAEYYFLILKFTQLLTAIGHAFHDKDMEVHLAMAPYTTFRDSMPLLHPFSILRAATPQVSPTMDFDSDKSNEDSEENENDDEEESIGFDGEKKKKKEKEPITEPAALDGIMIMTYDYSAGAFGPNSPLDWALTCVEGLNSIPPADTLKQMRLGDISPCPPDKIYLGLPFYGYDYKEQQPAGTVLRNQYISIIRNYKTKITWNEQTGEHEVNWTDENQQDHTTIYPSFLSCRLRAVHYARNNYNMAVWDLGQGLDYFIDAI